MRQSSFPLAKANVQKKLEQGNGCFTSQFSTHFLLQVIKLNEEVDIPCNGKLKNLLVLILHMMCAGINDRSRSVCTTVKSMIIELQGHTQSVLLSTFQELVTAKKE